MYVLTSPLGPSYTLNWEKLCFKTPGHSLSYWAGHSCMVSSSLSSVPLSNRSFSWGIQKGKVWHTQEQVWLMGKSAQLQIQEPCPAENLRGLFFFSFSFSLRLRREVLETQPRFKKKKKSQHICWFGLRFDYLKLNLPQFNKTTFGERKGHRILNCKWLWVSALLTVLK